MNNLFLNFKKKKYKKNYLNNLKNQDFYQNQSSFISLNSFIFKLTCSILKKGLFTKLLKEVFLSVKKLKKRIQTFKFLI